MRRRHPLLDVGRHLLRYRPVDARQEPRRHQVRVLQRTRRLAVLQPPRRVRQRQRLPSSSASLRRRAPPPRPSSPTRRPSNLSLPLFRRVVLAVRLRAAVRGGVVHGNRTGSRPALGVTTNANTAPVLEQARQPPRRPPGGPPFHRQRARQRGPSGAHIAAGPDVATAAGRPASRVRLPTRLRRELSGPLFYRKLRDETLPAVDVRVTGARRARVQNQLWIVTVRP